MNMLARQLFAINFVAASVSLALSGGASMWVLRLNDEEKLVGVALCVGMLLIGYVVHFMLVRPLIEEMEWANPREAQRAVTAMRNFPVRAAKYGWYIWSAMAIAGSAFYYVYFGEWTLEDRYLSVTLLMFGSILSGGGVSFMLQFYAYKMAILPRLREALKLVPDRAFTERLHEVPAYGLRNKLVVSALTLLAGSLLFSVLFGYTRIAEGLQDRLVLRADAVMQRLAPEVEQALDDGEIAALAERLSSMQLGAGGQFFVIARDGRDVLGTAGRAVNVKQLLSEGRADWRSSQVVHRISLKKGAYVFVAVFPWNQRGDMAGTTRAFMALFIVVSLVTIWVANFSAREIATPVKEIVYRAERIARGDLSEPLELLSEDEVGEFSADLEQVRRLLLSILNDIDGASRQVESLSQKVLAASQTVAHASFDQSSRISTGLHAIEKVASGFERISKGSVELTSRATEGGSSIFQLDATVRQVDVHTDHMVDRVESIRDGIDKMNRVSELIFANLGDLSRSMDTTVRNIRKFSDSIRRNEERVGTARAVSTRVLEASGDGLEHTGQTAESIRVIAKSVDGISGILEDLIQRLNDVGKLIGVIDEVADDTKLLSLNAAIIAAQAGAKGRSFSVLAEKIKILADSTNAATGQIIDMIEEVGDGSHVLANGMEKVRQGVKNTREAARDAGTRLQTIIQSAQAGYEGMALIASTSGRHVEQGQAVERAVVGLANAVEQIHGSVRGQRNRAAEVGTAMERVEAGVRTLKTASRAQAEGGRVLSGSIEQVVTMVTHLKKILHEQQTEVLRIQEAMRAIEEGALANNGASKKLQREVEALRAEAETFHRFVERFKLA